RGKGIKSLPLADVVRPGQSLDSGLFHFVLERFREEQLVRNESGVERNGRRGPTKSDHMAVLSQNSDPESVYIEVKAIGGRLRIDGGQSSGKTAETGVIGRLVNGEGLDRVGWHSDAEAAGHGVRVAGRIDNQQALILVRTFEYQFAVECLHHAGRHGKNFLHFFLRGGQGNQLLIRDNG